MNECVNILAEVTINPIDGLICNHVCPYHTKGLCLLICNHVCPYHTKGLCLLFHSKLESDDNDISYYRYEGCRESFYREISQ